MADENNVRRNAAKQLVEVGVAAAVTVAFPPAGVVLGLASFLRGARRVAQTGDFANAQDLVTGYSDVAGGIDHNR